MSNNVKVAVIADIADIRTKMVAAQALVKETAKVFADAAKVVANGDTTEQAKANLLSAATGAVQAKTAFNALDTQYTTLTASVSGAGKSGAAFVASLKLEAETAGLTKAQLLELKAARLGVSEEAAPFIAAVTANDLSAGQRYIEQLREQVATARLSKAEMLEYRAAQLGVTQEAAPLIARLAELNATQVRATGISGQQRFALMVVGEQLRQVSTEAALGISPMQIFAQQSGQTVQALSMVAGEGTALGAFLMSGWGIAVTTATAALAPLVAELVKTSGVLADVGDAAETAMAKLNQSLDKSSDFTKVAAEANKKYIGGLKELADAQRDLKSAQESRAAGGAINGPFGAGVARPDQDVVGAQARVDAAKKKIKDAQDELNDLRDAQRVAELQDAARAKLDAKRDKPKEARVKDTSATERKREVRRDQQIADSNADRDLSIARAGNTDATASAQAQFEQALANTTATSAIGAAERKRDALIAAAQAEAKAEEAAVNAKAAARRGDEVAATEARNQVAVIEANLTTKLRAIDRQYTDDHERELQRRRVADQRAAEQREQAWRGANEQIMEAESQLVSGILSGRQSLGQAIINVGANVVAREIQADLQYLTERKLLAAEGLAVETANTRKGLLLHLLTTQQKTASVATGQAAETATVVGGEAAKTAAVLTGSATRTATTAAASAASAKIVGKHNLKEITSHAATAAAAAYHAMAAIPVIGPALGAAAAAATFVAVESFGALASFDKGTNYVPNDMVAQIHAGERIVPAADNRELMAAVRGGGDNTGGDTHLHYNPVVHGQLPFADQLAAHEDNIISIMKRAARSGSLRY